MFTIPEVPAILWHSVAAEIEHQQGLAKSRRRYGDIFTDGVLAWMQAEVLDKGVPMSWLAPNNPFMPTNTQTLNKYFDEWRVRTRMEEEGLTLFDEMMKRPKKDERPQVVPKFQADGAAKMRQALARVQGFLAEMQRAGLPVTGEIVVKLEVERP